MGAGCSSSPGTARRSAGGYALQAPLASIASAPAPAPMSGAPMSEEEERNFSITHSDSAMDLNVSPGSKVAAIGKAYGFDVASVERHESGGERGTLEWRMHFTINGKVVSPWHDVPLYANDADPRNSCVHMLTEIPKWSRRKFEIAPMEPASPIKQDSKKGKVREYVWGDMMFNYGALPQTWEDPDTVDPDTGCKGDADPIDCVEVGNRRMETGEVARVKVLGALAMIDDGEADWKLISVREGEPLFDVCHDLDDLKRELPGVVEALHHWLKMYKTAEGKGENDFAFGGAAVNRAKAMDVVAHTHQLWKDYLAKNGSNRLDQLPGAGATAASDMLRVSSVNSIASDLSGGSP